MKQLVGLAGFSAGVTLLVVALYYGMTTERQPQYAFCPQPDITAYQVARIIAEQSKAAGDAALRRHMCELP